MAKIVIEKGSDKGKSYTISTQAEVVVGRDATVQFRITDTMASRRHFKIEKTGGLFKVVDLNSMNGTFLNGKKIQASPLKGGESIQVGETLFSFVMDDAAKDDLIGKVISGYRIIDRIGRGGMGIVYKAEQVDLQRTVALKVLSPDYTKDQNSIEALLHEARSSAQLNHHNIVQVYDVRRDGGISFFSMEYMPGGSVQEMLNRQKSIPVNRSIQMIIDAAQGLAFAHKKGILHRDIKPDNLMLAESGEVKIGDLGLAKRAGDGRDEQAGVVFGTPHYIAPEQVQGKPADIRSDIYSLGATFYRMATGMTPYSAPTVKDLIAKKTKEDPQPPNKIVPAVSPKLSRYILSMMSRNFDQRPQSADAIVAELSAMKNAAEVAPPPMTKTSSSVQTMAMRKTDRKPWEIAAAIFLSLGIVAAVIFIVVKSGDKPAPTPPPAPPVVQTQDNPQQDNSIEKLASVYFEQAEESSRKMNRYEPSKIEETMALYRKVVDECGTSKLAPTAKSKIAELETVLLEARARNELLVVEKKDVANLAIYRNKLLADPNGDGDGGLIDLIVAEYTALANSQYKATKAAQEARLAADYIKKWKAKVAEAKKEYDRVARRAEEKAKKQEYQAAVDILAEFVKTTQAQAPKENVLGNRYSTLIYDTKAEGKLKQVVSRAEEDFRKVVAEAKEAAAKNLFDDAIRKLDIATSVFKVPSMIAEAKALQRAVEDQRRVYREELAKKAEDDARKLEEEKRRRHEEEVAKDGETAEKVFAEEIYGLIRKYDFDAAVASADKLMASLKTDEWRRLIRKRVGQLQSAAEIKKEMIDHFNDLEKRKKTDIRWKLGDEFREISRADAANLYFRTTGGDFGKRWDTEFRPDKFIDFIKTRWKLQPDELRKLIILSLELGQYEVADKLLESLSKSDDPSDEFAREYEQYAANGTLEGSVELDAARRLDRVAWAILDKNGDKARKELEIAKEKYESTNVVKSSGARISQFERDISALPAETAGGKEGDQKLTYESFSAFNEFKIMKIDKREILKRLKKLPSDDLLTPYLIGEHYFYTEDLSAAEEVWSNILKIRKNIDKDKDKDKYRLLADTYCSLGILYAVKGSAQGVQQVIKDGDGYFGDFDVWQFKKKEIEQYVKSIQTERSMQKRRIENARQNPQDPDAVWIAALSYERTHQHLKACSLYRALIDYFPSYNEVKSGEALYKLAEYHYAIKDAQGAIDLFQELKDSHPDHPKARNSGDADSADKRIEFCERLLSKTK